MDFQNKQVIIIEGETNGRPTSELAPLPYGEDYWQVGPIGGQWSSPGFEGQMIADRWKPPSPKRKQSGGRMWGVEESSTIATRWIKVWHDVILTQCAHPRLTRP